MREINFTKGMTEREVAIRLAYLGATNSWHDTDLHGRARLNNYGEVFWDEINGFGSDQLIIEYYGFFTFENNALVEAYFVIDYYGDINDSRKYIV